MKWTHVAELPMADRVRALTPRERECLTLLREHRRKAISEILHISSSSVGTHLLRAARKLGTKKSIQAAFALQRFEIESEVEYLSWGKS